MVKATLMDKSNKPNSVGTLKKGCCWDEVLVGGYVYSIGVLYPKWVDGIWPSGSMFVFFGEVFLPVAFWGSREIQKHKTSMFI